MSRIKGFSRTLWNTVSIDRAEGGRTDGYHFSSDRLQAETSDLRQQHIERKSPVATFIRSVPPHVWSRSPSPGEIARWEDDGGR